MALRRWCRQFDLFLPVVEKISSCWEIGERMGGVAVIKIMSSVWRFEC